MTRRLLAASVLLFVLPACATETETETSDSGTSNLDGYVPITVLHNDRAPRERRTKKHSDAELAALVRANVKLGGMREAKVEEIASHDGTTHLVVQAMAVRFHALTVARIDIDAAGAVTHVTNDYARTAEDESNGASSTPVYRCPDPEVEFITICPNDNSAEIAWANEAGDAAVAAGLPIST